MFSYKTILEKNSTEKSVDWKEKSEAETEKDKERQGVMERGREEATRRFPNQFQVNVKIQIELCDCHMQI